MGEVSGRQVYFSLSPAEDQAMWQAFREGNATAALNHIITTHVAREHHAGQAECDAIKAEALREAAEWLAAAGYPIEFTMPDLPPPPALFSALVDVIHEDATGRWHGNELTRDETESWLRCEMGEDA